MNRTGLESIPGGHFPEATARGRTVALLLTVAPLPALPASAGGVLVAGDPDGSRLVRAIGLGSGGASPLMPAEGDPLTGEQVELVRQWIARGAPWPEGMVPELPLRGDPGWWSLQHPAPEPGRKDLARNGIDAFIQRTLHDRGLRPSLEADRRTLIRRPSFDLHGLPPAPEEIHAFPEDPRPDASERLVDSLLAHLSPAGAATGRAPVGECPRGRGAHSPGLPSRLRTRARTPGIGGGTRPGGGPGSLPVLPVSHQRQ